MSLTPFNVPFTSKSLTADGTATGSVTVDNNTAFPVGARVFLSSGTVAAAEYEVVSLTGSTIVNVRRVSSTPNYGLSDVSALTVADGATIVMNEQIVYGKINETVYEEVVTIQEAQDLIIKNSDASYSTAVTQESDLLTFRNKSGTILMTLSATGVLSAGGVAGGFTLGNGATISQSGGAITYKDNGDASSIGHKFDTTITKVGGNIAQWNNNTVVKAYINSAGSFISDGFVKGYSGISASNGTNALITNPSGAFLYKDDAGATTAAHVLDTTTSKTGSTNLFEVRNAGLVNRFRVIADGSTETSGNSFVAGYVYPSLGYTMNGASSLKLIGTAADGATAVALKVQNSNALSTAGSKVVSFYSDNGTTEVANLATTGRLTILQDFVTATGKLSANAGNTGITITSNKNAADAGTDFILNTPVNRTNGVLLSVQNNGVEKVGIDYLGTITSVVSKVSGSGYVTTFNAAALQMIGNVADGVGAIGLKFGNVNTLTSSSDRYIAKWYLDYSTTEKMSLTTSGILTAQSSIYSGNGLFSTSAANNSVAVGGNINDGAAAIAVKIFNTNTLSNSSAKIVSFYNDNGSTEKGYVTSTGLGQFNGGVSAGASGQFTITSTGKVYLPTGAAGIVGQATLVGGTVTVSTTAVTASSIIMLTRGSAAGTTGDLRVGTITAGVSFVIDSASGTDTSVVNWMIVN